MNPCRCCRSRFHTRLRRNPAGILLGVLAVAIVSAYAETPVRFSRHNLSMSGPASIHASDTSEICVFCHGPHGVAPSAPLWNRATAGAVYIPYHSTTAKARIGQPTGASAMCLSCHDGTVAMGKLLNRRTEARMQAGVTRMPHSRANLGTDLSDDHPVSFTYDAGLLKQSNGELRDPATFPPEVHLDMRHQMQCTSCHDPHDNTYGKFLVMDNQGAALCVVCHAKRYWAQSSHRTSAARWNGAAPDPWPNSAASTVAQAGCDSCHTSHQAGTPQRLLVFPTEEGNCLACHNGHVARGNLVPEFSKLSRHNIMATTGVHDPTEDLINSSRHVECVDCHNPHADNETPASAPLSPGSLAGVAGVNTAGAVTVPATREYELCFRCHADSSGKGEARVARDHPQTNTRIEFSTDNASFHPVEGPGRNPDVPSLVSPWRASSVMYCTDCHNNDQGPRAGGKGPDGPHGSTYVPILERSLELRDFQQESASTYALCYKCHSRDSILANDGFSLHRLHIAEARTACTTCHDSHGVPGATHLINFNRSYVSPNGGGQLRWTDQGLRQGSCSLVCHEKDHDNLAYNSNGPIAPVTTTGAAAKSQRRSR